MRGREARATLLVLAIAAGCAPRPAPPADDAGRPAPGLPPSVVDYFRRFSRSSVELWHVLGPFSSPHDAIERDLLLAAGGEAHARPTAGPITVPPRTQVRWRPVHPLRFDRWTAKAYNTRYTGYVPLSDSETRHGPDTALAYGELASGGGLTRLLLTAWGKARLLVDGREAVGVLEAADFFGQDEAFVELTPGTTPLLVKVENETYNATAGAVDVYGSWGFYLDTWPAGSPAEGFYLDVPFLADVTTADTRLTGLLAVRARAGAARGPDRFEVTLRWGPAALELSLLVPPPGEARFRPFMLDGGAGAPRGETHDLVVSRDGGELVRVPVRRLPPRSVCLSRALISPSDETLQPYILAMPSRRSRSPLLVYLHGAGTTEEELVNAAPELIALADKEGVVVCAPRAREGALLSGQAEEDILLTIEEVRKDWGLERAPFMLAGSGTGALCALRLASHFPHLVAAVAAVPGNAFERAAGRAPDLSLLDPMAENLRDLPVLLAVRDGDRGAQYLRKRLEAAGAAVTEAELAAFLQTPVRPVPAAVTFTTTRLRWDRAWWIGLAGFTDTSRPARIEARLAGEGRTVEITSDNAAGLYVYPSLLPGRPPDELTVRWNGTEVFAGPVGDRLSIECGSPVRGGKRKGTEGPLDELLRAPYRIIVPAVVPAAAGWTELVAGLLPRNAARARFGRNPGAWAPLIRTADEPLGDAGDTPSHLILVGGPGRNPHTARFVERLGLDLTDDAIGLAGRSFPLERGVLLLVRHDPQSAERLVAILAGGALESFARLAAASERNPFAYPERFPDVVVWRLDASGEDFDEVFRGAYDQGWERVIPLRTSGNASQPVGSSAW